MVMVAGVGVVGVVVGTVVEVVVGAVMGVVVMVMGVGVVGVVVEVVMMMVMMMMVMMMVMMMMVMKRLPHPWGHHSFGFAPSAFRARENERSLRRCRCSLAHPQPTMPLLRTFTINLL